MRRIDQPTDSGRRAGRLTKRSRPARHRSCSSRAVPGFMSRPDSLHSTVARSTQTRTAPTAHPAASRPGRSITSTTERTSGLAIDSNDNGNASRPPNASHSAQISAPCKGQGQAPHFASACPCSALWSRRSPTPTAALCSPATTPTARRPRKPISAAG